MSDDQSFVSAPAYDEPEPDDDSEFTQAHIDAATRAHALGKVVVLDRGPSEPEPATAIVGERTDAEIEADNKAALQAKRDHDDWHEKNKEPLAVQMDKIDADHAVNADPKRYVHVPRGLRAPVTIEERVTRLEQRLGPETPDEIKHRAERAKVKKAE